MDAVVGIHAVAQALEAGGRRVRRLLVQRGRRAARLERLVESARRRGIPVQFGPRSALDRLAGEAVHQGVVALAGPLPTADEAQVLEAAGRAAFLVVLDQVEDPRNLGAVARTAVAAGAHGLFLPGRGAAPATAAAIKASAGALERIPVVQVGNLPSLLTRLRERGIWLVGLDSAGEALWGGFDWTLPLALVVGGEGKGLRRLVRERCDVLLGIPMPGGGGSLNVSVAAALALYEVVRGRAVPPG